MSIPNNWGDWRPNLTPHTGNLQATDLIECTMIVGGLPVNTAITGAQIIAASGGSIAWGAITGTLSAQTDLQTALNAKQATLVSGTNIKTVNSTSLLGSGDVAVQPTLVSGTNIKTINSTSLLGSGDIAISSGLTVGTTAIASGTVGRILFEGTGNVLQESAGLSFTVASNQLNIGTSTYLRGGTNYTDSFATGWGLYNCGLQSTLYGNNNNIWNVNTLSVGSASASARLDVKAAGALSTDLAFRVRNSADTANIFQINGDGSIKTNAINLGNTPASNFTAPFLSITNAGSTSLSFATMNNNLYSFDVDRYCNLITNGGGVNTNATGALLLGTGGTPSNRNYQATVAGLNAISQGTNDSGFAQTGGDTSGNNAMYVNYIGKNWTIGGTLQGNGKRVFSIITGTAPTTNILDGFQQYSADIVAGNAAPHFRTENGNIIKLYQQPTGGASSTFVLGVGTAVTDASTFDGYTLGQIVKALRNTGILA
jgi:hypothetical protein